ncbi:MAG: type III pantothenate kinase [Bacteroidales bacterium]|nr:type III pantothenate kinase [Candidatus Colicola faecequi]
MNLCIDQGNSRTKMAIFADDGRMINNFIYKSFTALDVERLCQLYQVDNGIISSVVNVDAAVVNVLHRCCKEFILFDYTTPVPIKNCYDTPRTLGQDRLAAAVGANFLHPDDDLLIIDAGSAITYDFVSNKNEYLGGNIAPGLSMRCRALKNQTKKLPLVEIDEKQIIPLFGTNTHDAILAGVVRGIKFEIEGYIHTLERRVDHFTTLITGGSAAYILPNLREQVEYQKHLVLLGLNRILTYNLRERKE